jgi:hypothetical protein
VSQKSQFKRSHSKPDKNAAEMKRPGVVTELTKLLTKTNLCVLSLSLPLPPPSLPLSLSPKAAESTPRKELYKIHNGMRAVKLRKDQKTSLLTEIEIKLWYLPNAPAFWLFKRCNKSLNGAVRCAALEWER